MFQCSFKEPEKLSVFDSLSINGEFVRFELSGSDSFVVTHNYDTKIYETNSIIVPLHKGINTFSISTGLEVKESSTSFSIVKRYLFIQIPLMIILIFSKWRRVRLVIRDMTGSIYLNEIKNINQQRLVSLNVHDFSSGIYFIEISGLQLNNFQKF